MNDGGAREAASIYSLNIFSNRPGHTVINLARGVCRASNQKESL
jgi:hypothetical protein